MKVKKPEWKEFEIAVTNFIKALDPEAKVTHDAMIPDKDTGTPRQRDVWIETKVSKLFSLQILVSCKRYKTKLNQQHMDAFIGELLSSGAQKGVIYSYSGFTKPALEKAKARGISCCRLYQGEPADIPEVLNFHAYLMTPVFHFWAAWLEVIEDQPQTLGELFALNMLNQERMPIKLLDLILSKHAEKRARVRSNAQQTGSLPKKWIESISLPSPNTGGDMLTIEFGGDWDFFEATLEGYLLNGTYEFTDGEFHGEQSFPEVHHSGPQPGSHWRGIEALPNDIDKELSIGVLYGSTDSIKKHLLNSSEQTIQNVSEILKNT